MVWNQGLSAQEQTDRDRIHRMFVEYRESVFRTAYAILRDREEALDVVQDTFVKAMKKIRKLEDGPVLRGWLVKVARNLSIDRYRRRKWDGGTVDEEMSGRAPEKDREMTMDMKEMIRQAFPSLPRRQQQVFALRYYEDMTFAEIAAAMSVSEGTVKTLHHRAIGTMRQLAGRKWGLS